MVDDREREALAEIAVSTRALADGNVKFRNAQADIPSVGKEEASVPVARADECRRRTIVDVMKSLDDLVRLSPVKQDSIKNDSGAPKGKNRLLMLAVKVARTPLT